MHATRQRISRRRRYSGTERVITLMLPRWIGTFAGFIAIGGIALFVAVVSQARLIDALDVKTSILQAETARVLADHEQVRVDVRAKNMQLAELQTWRVAVTIAARSGWNAAHRYIRESRLTLPVGSSKGQEVF